MSAAVVDEDAATPSLNVDTLQLLTVAVAFYAARILVGEY